MTLHHGDCLDVMAAMDPESVDAIVTDPPYGINFMGKAWDGAAITENVRAYQAKYVAPKGDKGRTKSAFRNEAGAAGAYDFSIKGNRAFQEWTARWAEAAYRVAKPSAYLLAFGGTRTVHRMTCALEDAGWVIRDMLVWAYASGFPKSKASLKPAWEPIVMARKPGPLRMLAIDECRIGYVSEDERAAVNGRTGPNSRHREQVGGGVTGSMTKLGERHVDDVTHPSGRWPANVLLSPTEDGRAIFDGGVEGVVGGGETQQAWGKTSRGRTDPESGWGYKAQDVETDYGDSGTYSRFFLIPKADRSDREPVLGGIPLQRGGAETMDVRDGAGADRMPMRRNVHPTVKPTDLMRHLVRLVTPTGGTVLDPFLGSGTTALAAEMEGFAWVGIEREAEYVAIAEARLNGTQRGLGLETA